MTRFLSELLVAIIAFASTNIDDLLMLSSLFVASNFRTASVVIGQFIGKAYLFSPAAVLIVRDSHSSFAGLHIAKGFSKTLAVGRGLAVVLHSK